MKKYIFFLVALAHCSLHAQFKKVTFDPSIKVRPEDKILDVVRSSDAVPVVINSEFIVRTIDMPTREVMNSGLRPGVINERNVPSYIEGQLKNTGTRSSGPINRAMEYIEIASSLMKIKNPLQEFEIKGVETDELGITHVRAFQKVNGVPVYGTEILVHGKNNDFDFLNGSYYPTIENINTKPSIDLVQCEIIIDNNINTKPEYSENVKSLFKNLKEDSQLMIYHKDDTFYLVYHVTTYKNLVDRWEYFVDAHSGEIIHKFQSICKFHNHITEAPTDGTNMEVLDGQSSANALDLFSTSRVVNTYQVGSKYYLIDGSRDIFAPTSSKMPNDPNGVIWTIDAFNTSPAKSTFDYDHVISTNNTWSNKTAVSAHYNGGKSFEYYRTVHNRKSINGLSGNIVSLINVADDDGSSMGNAFWNGQAMFYGNGDAAFLPLARGLDVAGHEMSHGVIESTANLEYEGESGALNESFADVFGVLIDRDDWKIGEDVVKISAFPSGALRSMEDPHNGAATNDFNRGWQPRTYDERYKGTEDNGGVHLNSGIPNWAFYKFATAVGKDKAEKVYYRTLTNYLTKSSKFVDARIAVIKATTDLYGTTEINAAKKAFDEVGILGDTGGNYQTDVLTNPGDEYIVTTSSSNTGLYLFNSSGTSVKQLSTSGLISKPSVSDNGKYIIFVGSDKKIHEITMDWSKSPFTNVENVYNTPAIWRNAIVSKDGLKIAGITQDTVNEIIVYYLGGTTTAQSTFQLYNPTYTQGVSTGDVLYSDAMEFDVTGEYIMYDAENKIKSSTSGSISYWDIGFIKVWNNATKTFSLGKIDKLFSSLPNNVSVGNPTFSKNSPYIISFDYLDENDDVSILGANTETGTTALIYENNDLGFPNYSAKDNKLVFDNVNSTQTAYNVGVIDLKTNKIEPSANPFLFITNRRWATWFSNGNRILSGTNDTESALSSDIKVTGNPITDHLQIELADNMQNNPSLVIVDMLGKIVKSQNFNGVDKNISIQISDLVPGLYAATVTSGLHQSSVKFVKQ
jgi:Zn-dependent metalloprotease